MVLHNIDTILANNMLNPYFNFLLGPFTINQYFALCSLCLHKYLSRMHDQIVQLLLLRVDRLHSSTSDLSDTSNLRLA